MEPVAFSLSTLIDNFQDLVEGFFAVGSNVVTFITSTPLALVGVLSWLSIVAISIIQRFIKN